ncbi:MAG: helix-turn-helix transcriptional regulator [Clostridia bacterium]|nr:helix-turn-helix transcriptional regulator [Clostridia bacterium]
MKNLGETIKAARIEKNLTQPQLAKIVGVSAGMISIWENNINEPKASYIKALAAALDISADYLLGLSDY